MRGVGVGGGSGSEPAPEAPRWVGTLSLRRVSSFPGHLGFPDIGFTPVVIFSECSFAQSAFWFETHSSSTLRLEVGYIF